MLTSKRIGALDITSARSDRIGSYVDLYSIEFLAVEESRIHCWYQSPLADGPVFHIDILRNGTPGTEQQIETP